MHKIDNQDSQTSIQELFAGLSPDGRFAHLQLFLSRKNEKHQLPMYFLWVSRNAFGKVRLDDLDFDGTHIHLDIQECTTGFRKTVSVDVNDEGFKFLMISWDDIRNMVMTGNKLMSNTDDLLELE